jgi:acetolactate synthase I/II/III large subunit
LTGLSTTSVKQIQIISLIITINITMENNSVALYILKALKEEGVDHIFLVPGYSLDPFVKNYSTAKIHAVVAAHEGGAAYMADGYARARQSFGVCMGIGGPGVTNMVTAIAAAYADRSPVLVISGALPAEWNGDGIFQDSSSTGVDDCEIMHPITAWTQRIPSVYKEKQSGSYQPEYRKVQDFLQKAMQKMGGVENRPVFLSVPFEVLNGKYDARYTPRWSHEPARILDQNTVQKIPEILRKATRIAILAGNGCVRSQAGKAIQEFAEKFSIPVVTTLRAKGVIAEDQVESPMSFGFFGNAGTLQANKVVMGSPSIPQAEVLLVLGATLNEGNTYAWGKDFPPSMSLIRVDINPNIVTGKNYDETLIVGDVREFLDWLRNNAALFAENLQATQPERQAWLQKIRETPYYDFPNTRTGNTIPIHPAQVVVKLREVAPRNTVLVVDSGAHSYHVPHHWTAYAPNEFLILTNTGPMGYGIALGIGAKLARPNQPCVAIVGDGSILMHGMELQTAVRYQIPLIVVVINNSALGNVYLRAIDQDWPEEAVELVKIPTLHCVELARSFGADGIVVEHPEQLADAFQQAFVSQIPFVVDVRCSKDDLLPNNPYASEPENPSRNALQCR